MISPKGKQGRYSVWLWGGADRVVFNQVSKVIRQLLDFGFGFGFTTVWVV